MKHILSILVLLLSGVIISQNIDAINKKHSILLLNGIAHIGNGTVIQNSAVGFKDGKIILVADATTIRINPAEYDTIINISKKHVYPGFIATNSTLGLTEIDAVRATNDINEVGDVIPNIRTLIAYNTDSKITPTIRTNGILVAQICPRRGMLAGTSSVFLLDGWNWEDAVIKADEGLHLYFPHYPIEKTKDPKDNDEKKEAYIKRMAELKKFFADAKAYNETSQKKEKNLRFESLKGIFGGTQKLYIHADYAKDILNVISFVNEFEIKQAVLVGGKDIWPVVQQFKESGMPLMLGRVHDLPLRTDDDIDLPFKLPSLLQKEGILFCLQNEGDMAEINVRNLPFLAGTAAAYGITKEEALQSITLNAAKITGLENILGSLENNKQATLFVSSGDALDMKSNNVELAFFNGKAISLDNDQKTLYEKYMKKYGLK